MILVVPMDPEYLPEAALLIGAVFLGVAAARSLLARHCGRGLRQGGVAIACFALAVLLPRAGHHAPGTPALFPAAKSSELNQFVSLVLGGVILHVLPSEHYELSVDGAQFLELDLHRTELRVTCTVASGIENATRVVQNTFPARSGDLETGRDPHSLFVRTHGHDVLRVHYADPRRIEVEGDFYDRRKDDEDALNSVQLISLHRGIEWTGGRLPAGTTLDLTKAGKGRIDFGPTGEVRVSPL